MSDSKQNRIYFYGLDEIRAIAALLVYFHHVELFKNRESHSSLYQVKYTGHFIWNIGHNSVVCFFVLSGFLITYLLLKEKEKIGTDLPRSLLKQHRLHRLKNNPQVHGNGQILQIIEIILQFAEGVFL